MLDEKIKKMELEQQRIDEFNKKVDQINLLKYEINRLFLASTYATRTYIHGFNIEGGIEVSVSPVFAQEALKKEADLKTEQLNKLIKEVEEY